MCTNARRAVVTSTGFNRGCMKGINKFSALDAESDVNRWLVRGAPADPEFRLRWLPITRNIRVAGNRCREFQYQLETERRQCRE
jgi:hypothetical protein